MKQKILLATLVAISALGSGCGGPSTSSNLSSQGGLIGPSACYLGEKSKGTTCVTLMSIDAAKEKYLNPFTDPSFMSGANKEQYRMPVQAVDLKVVSPSLKIAPNFVLSEFMSLEKGPYGIFSTTVVKKIQEIRTLTGASLRVNSAYRSPKWNAGISGAAKWSRHQYGDAVDIASSGATLNELVQLCRNLGAIYVDKYATHVHCDWRNTPLEPTFFGHVHSGKVQEFTEEEARIRILNNLHETSFIHVSGELKAGNIVLLTSEVTYKEDNEELYKEWEIIAPNGDRVIFEQSEVSLYLRSGTYQIVHTIGENIRLKKSLFVQ